METRCQAPNSCSFSDFCWPNAVCMRAAMPRMVTPMSMMRRRIVFLPGNDGYWISVRRAAHFCVKVRALGCLKLPALTGHPLAEVSPRRCLFRVNSVADRSSAAKENQTNRRPVLTLYRRRFMFRVRFAFDRHHVGFRRISTRRSAQSFGRLVGDGGLTAFHPTRWQPPSGMLLVELSIPRSREL